MNAPVRDPARAALARVLELTVAKQAFPRESTVLRLGGGLGDAARRLLDDGRYLGRVVAGDEGGRWPIRVALKVPGAFEAPGPEGTAEVQGLTRTYDRLISAVQHGYFARSVRLKELHPLIAPDLDLLDFRRWCTMLTSPRLQGRYLTDEIGFCGLSDAVGAPSKQKGYFLRLQLFGSFANWPLPQQEPPRPFLLDDAGLHVDIDADGNVQVMWGLGESVTLPPGLGSRVLAALVDHPRCAIHSLDLQAYDPRRFPIPSAAQRDECAVDDTLADLDIEYDAFSCTAEQLDRLGAVVRRISALEAVARSSEPPPRWAADAARRGQDLTQDLVATLKFGPLTADFPAIKNANKVVHRALDEVLNHRELGRFRNRFRGGERLEYHPPP